MENKAADDVGFKIHEVSVRDLARIIELENDSFSDPWHQQQFLDVIWNGFIFWGLYIGTEIGGYLVAIPYEEGIHIANIVIAPAFRRCGFGRKFLRKLNRLAVRSQKRYITLEVRRSNRSAIALYESEKFYQFGIRQRYYDGKEDALLFVQELTHA